MENFMRINGKLFSWNDDKGYGFISPVEGGDRVFVHISGFDGIAGRPVVGQPLSYVLSTDRQGRPCAEAVLVEGRGLSQGRRLGSTIKALPLIGALGVLGLVAVAVFAGKMPWLFFGYYLLVSLITFAVYALDKSAARKGAWRTPEAHLHLLALAGGWPGALMAQKSLRHKSSKRSFQFVFWITVVLNSAGLIVFVSPAGQRWLEFHGIIG